MKFPGFIILFIISFITTQSFAQVKQYQTQWKKIDELITKSRLPKSALAEVKKLYALAKKENQPAQVIRTLVYTAYLQDDLRENNDVLSIKELEKEIQTQKEPAASILKSILATYYLDYLQQNRYQLYDRTNTIHFNKNDIATWTLEDLHKKISELFLSSLGNEQLLKQTKLEPFDAIIIKGNLRYLRPTLYDLLAHRALEYFVSDERDIVKPSFAFEIDQPEAFAPAAEFIKHTFSTRDSVSLQHKALLIYQHLIAFHLNDAKPDALIDVDIDRVEFVYRNSTSANKDSLYLRSLQYIADKYAGNSIAKQATYLLARWYSNNGNSYSPLKDTAHRFYKVKAKELLEAAIKDSSHKSQGWVNGYNLLQQITKPEFSFELEKVNVPALPFRVLVTYRNEPVLHLRLVKADAQLKKQLETRNEDDAFWSTLMNAAAIKTWNQQLPETNDLQQHKVEIKVDGLPIGEYYLVASSDEKYSKSNTRVGARMFYVSNISFANQKENFFVLHRETGLPLVNATVKVYKNIYDYKTSKYTRAGIGNFKTDVNGYFKLVTPKDERYNSYYFDISHHDDRLDLDESQYAYYYNDYENRDAKAIKKTFFFTDRSIYRPGQTVFFKGIVINQLAENKGVAADYSTSVYLYDANYQVRDSMKLTTNEFGSFNGSFKLPQNALNGNFQIKTKNDGVAYFSVEEYKRPKFLVEFEEVKESYRVNDTITITGTAKAYAGNNIDGAKVVYRVVRKPRFIYRWYFRSWLPPVKEMEITNGETVTDKDGRFTIQFRAIPDKDIDVKTDPVFDYEVSVDVTDINGETRSGSETVTAGYKSLILDINIPERAPLDSLKQIMIRTENMNGEFQSSTVTVNFHKLSPEQRLIRKRYWEQPDQFVMSKEEYIRHFPHDEYSNETDMSTWRKTGTVGRTDSSRANGQWAIDNGKLTTGFYEIEIITKDKDGNEVKDLRYIELFDPKNGFNRPEYLWIGHDSKPIEPGESTSIQLGSAAQQVFLINQVDKKGSQGFTEIPIGQKGKQPFPGLEHNETEAGFRYTTINNEKKTFPFTATESDRGGYGVHFFFIKDNRLYQYGDIISVPWSNKELKIEYATFRDKTLPGSEETWKVKISGYKGEQVAAEMLASMYDASLDQFRPHNWNKPNLWPSYYNNLNWNDDLNFTAVASSNKWIPEKENKNIPHQYDVLTAYPYVLENNRRAMLRGNAGVYGLRSMESKAQRMAAPPAVDAVFKNEVAESADSTAVMNADGTDDKTDFDQTTNEPIQVRKNFNETAFFFPDLKTDANGNIEFSFTAPEALTRWKIQTLAHTKELAFGLSSKEMVTQKELMVQPNMPRFVRQGDRMELTAKIVNLSDKEMTGQAQLMLFDATTNQSVDGYFINTFPNQYFTVAAGQSEVVKFPVQVPFQFNHALTWRIIARSGNFSDGEEMTLPVLTNKVLVTETLPMPVSGSETKNFRFEKLLQSGNSETLQHHSLSVEYTSNPAWYAVQALPYLMEYPYDCAEQTWNRYYANALASHIANATPRIRQIFEKWKTIDTSALISNLEKNQELKSALLEETPWVLQARSESEQKRNIALLFDMVKMSNEMQANLEKLKQMQSSNGGFVWFKGGPDDRYITQYIITGIGHLKKLGVQTENLSSILRTALPYLDKKIKEDYDNLIKQKAKLISQQVSDIQIQYLYMRSFFPEIAIPAASKTAYNYYRKQSQQFWTKQSKYMQGMTALALSRTADKTTPSAILRSLKESSIMHEELGRYWKDNQPGISWRWSQAPIETQSLMIEAFNEINKDTRTVDELRTWLIKNKQTNNWRTTKATADAAYAMLLQGTDWLGNEPEVEIKLGSVTLNNKSGSEAGTGYFKQTIAPEKISPAMGNITVSVENKDLKPGTVNTSWGAVYWQYFEDMDKVTTAATPLQLNKKLFIEKNSDRGPVLTPVEEGTQLNVGDKIKVRIELRVDRDMEYMHMKDMRASALEPVNVLSGYKWQDGLGYYESTKDASTNFFFNHLRKGTYVFEYPLFVTHTGNFTNGITTIQCMYAPEFSAHSEGVRITIE